MTLGLKKGALKAYLDEFSTIVITLMWWWMMRIWPFFLCSSPSSYKNFRETLLYRRDVLSRNDVKNE